MSLGRSLIKAMNSSFEEGKTTWEINKDEPFWTRVWYCIWLSDFYDPIAKIKTHCWNIPLERIERFWVYGKYLWSQGEWDHNWHTGLMELSFTRLHKIMEEGSGLLGKKKRKKMKIARALLHRVNNSSEYHEEPHDDYMDKRWGKSDIYWTDCSKGKLKMSRMHDRTEESLTEKQLELKNKEQRRMWKHQNHQLKQDLRMLGDIFESDLFGWWD